AAKAVRGRRDTNPKRQRGTQLLPRWRFGFQSAGGVMATTSPELIDALARIPGLLDAALAPADPAGRAARPAEALRALCPAAERHACRLGRASSVAAVDAAGHPRPDGAALLDGRQGVAGLPMLVTPLACAGRPYGALGVAVPDGSPAGALLA